VEFSLSSSTQNIYLDANIVSWGKLGEYISANKVLGEVTVVDDRIQCVTPGDNQSSPVITSGPCSSSYEFTLLLATLLLPCPFDIIEYTFEPFVVVAWSEPVYQANWMNVSIVSNYFPDSEFAADSSTTVQFSLTPVSDSNQLIDSLRLCSFIVSFQMTYSGDSRQYPHYF
jgi:hypothetical protein